VVFIIINFLHHRAFYRQYQYNNFRLLFVSEKIAFHAVLTSDIHGTTRGQTIVFNKVDINLGGGYNGTTGVFSAPVAGTYVFSLTFHLYYYNSSSDYAGDLFIMKNHEYLLRVWQKLDSSADQGTASGTTVLSLNKGDQVQVQAGSAHMAIGGGDVSFFSGFLLS